MHLPSSFGPSKRSEVARMKAPHGEKMIEVRIRFWTNDIAKRKGDIEPRHCWAAGTVHMTRNEAHGLKDDVNVKFNSMAELTAAVEKLMTQARIKMYKSRLESKLRVD